MKKPYFGRLLTAMVTPFNADGSVNYAAGADFADWLLANGSDGLVVEALPVKLQPWTWMKN